MLGRGENRPPGPQGRPDTQRGHGWKGCCQVQRPNISTSGSPIPLKDMWKREALPSSRFMSRRIQVDPDGSQRREGCASQWGGLGQLGAPHPPPPPSSSLPPPGSSWPSWPQPWCPVSSEVSHTDITDECRSIPPKMELILCDPSSAPLPQIPSLAQTLQGGPRPPR